MIGNIVQLLGIGSMFGAILYLTCGVPRDEIADYINSLPPVRTELVKNVKQDMLLGVWTAGKRKEF